MELTEPKKKKNSFITLIYSRQTGNFGHNSAFIYNLTMKSMANI